MKSLLGGWVTTRIVADALNVSQQRVLQMIYAKEIKAERMGGIWVIPIVELRTQRTLRKELASKDSRYVSPS